MEKVTTRIKLLLLFILLGAFSTFAQNQVTGTLTYHDTWGMDNSTVYLMDLNGNVLESCATDAAGNYIFNNVSTGDYLLSASTNLPAGGVDLGDAWLIMMHLYGWYPLTDIQAMAADVDGNGAVEWNDYFTIVFGWFNMGYPFPIGDWVFETVPITVTSARDGGGGGGLSSSSTGDVSGLYVPDKSFPYSPIEYLKTEIASLEHNVEYTIEFTSAQVIGGLQLNLNIPEDVTVTNVVSNLDDIEFHISEDAVRINWMDTKLLKNVNTAGITLELLVQDVPGAGSIKFEKDNSSHFIGENGNLLYGVELKFDEIELIEESPEPSKGISLNVGPNPFVDRTSLWISSQNQTKALFMVFDGSGNKVKEFEIEVGESANQQIDLDLSSLSAGVYHYRLWDSGNTVLETGSMIKLR